MISFRSNSMQIICTEYNNKHDTNLPRCKMISFRSNPMQIICTEFANHFASSLLINNVATRSINPDAIILHRVCQLICIEFVNYLIFLCSSPTMLLSSLHRVCEQLNLLCSSLTRCNDLHRYCFQFASSCGREK